MLKWHYRSRHHTLIAVSNHEFYSDKLFVVPSPADERSYLGLHFSFVAGGVYGRGGSRTNRTEARTVAEAIIRHATEYPEKSLGVGTFSVAQRDAILDEIELLRRGNPDTEGFFAPDTEEPFFVKNLESIQGDERDVILLSVGYGKDESGYMAMGFGPVSREGGERRLNVLISRARERCEVFSSITDDDIDLERAKSQGVQALKTFLHYARTGDLGVGAATGKGHDSDFEREVARALTAHGFRVEAQIGVAGFFIDLAIVDPDSPGRYLLGIECDGASYHSSRSARDRDRLREQVLTDRGWVIHRIWSTDWFQRPREQLKRTIEAIEAARIEWARRDIGESNSERQQRRNDGSGISRVEEAPGRSTEGSPGVIPYEEASFGVPTKKHIHELPQSKLAAIAAEVVRIEGPIHQKEVATRITKLWGLERTGSRITASVNAALAKAQRDGRVRESGFFCAPAGQTEVPVRNRAQVNSPSLRKPSFLPPEEVRRGLCLTIERHLGMTRDEAITQVARDLGFGTTSSQLKEVIDSELDVLIRDSRLDYHDDRVFPPNVS